MIKIPGNGKASGDLAQIYDKEFFRMHENNLPAFRELARLIDEVNGGLHGRSIVDVGCGHGFLVESLRERGYKESYGLEGSSSAQGIWPRRFHSFYKIQDLVFQVLTTNPVMSDGEQLFSSAHGNIAASGAAPSVTTVNAIRKLMTAQTGPSGEVLNIRPAILVGPTAMEDTLTVLRDAISGDATDDPLTPGYKAGRLSVVTDARLDADSELKWYVCADPRKHDGIQVVTLQGSRGLPLLEKKTQWVSDSIEWRILFDVAVLPVDYRTWCYNPGG